MPAIIYLSDNYSEYEFKTKRLWRTDGKYEPFVYIIQEVETEKVYIGSKTQYAGRPCLESWLGTKYFTSSKEFDWKSDSTSFEICRIIPCASNHDVLILEYKLIKNNFAVHDDEYYNKHHPYIGFSGSGKVGELHPNYGKKGEQSHNYGLVRSEETRKKISKAKTGCVSPNKGKKFTKESRQKMSESSKGRATWSKGKKLGYMSERNKQEPTVTCPHCGKSGQRMAMKRWHFDNCRNVEHKGT